MRRNEVRATDIPDDIFKDFKRFCKKEDRKMSQRARILIQDWVATQRQKEKTK